MKNIKVLDVTLRDGGCVIDFNFGHEYMNFILEKLEDSGVEVIELGYIDAIKGTAYDRTQFFNEKAMAEAMLMEKKEHIEYVSMIDYGKFDLNLLGERSAEGIDGIRLAFHKEQKEKVIEACKIILNKGYKCYLQPMITMRYSDSELLKLIENVNAEIPSISGFYIVDSFGEMRENDLNRILYLVENNLDSRIDIGLHSHNNLQLSYACAMTVLKFQTDRTIYIDSSVMGMGKGAGNLNTEILLEHLNCFYGKKYSIAPLLELLDKVISVIYSENQWGYSVEYYLSSVHHCSPSYAAFFHNKRMLTVGQMDCLLAQIPEEKRISFNKDYAEKLYFDFNARKQIDDSETLETLANVFCGKKVILIATGNSIIKKKRIIEKELGKENAIVVNLNHFMFPADYVFTARREAYALAKKNCVTYIVPSNISEGDDKYIIDYRKWVEYKDTVHDSSGVMLIKLMIFFGVSEIILAGFDGFDVDVDRNYFDKSLRTTVSKNEIEQENLFFKNFILESQSKVKIEFLTPSLYQQEET